MKNKVFSFLLVHTLFIPSVPQDARSIGVPNRAVGCSGKRQFSFLKMNIKIPPDIY